MKYQQYDYLNKTIAMTTPADTPMQMSYIHIYVNQLNVIYKLAVIYMTIIKREVLNYRGSLEDLREVRGGKERLEKSYKQDV